VHSVLQSPKKKRAIKKRTKFLVTMVFVAIALLFWGAVKIISLPSVQIIDVTVEGTKIMEKQIIAQKIDDELSGNYYWFFPKKNIFLYPKNKIKADIMSAFPTVETVTISVNSLHKLTMSIKEREPFALWCGDEQPSIIASEVPECFYVDKTGYIFSNSPSFSGGVYFTLYGSESLNVKKTPIGQYAVSTEVFEKVLTLRDFLSEFNIVFDTVYFGENNYAEFFNAKSFNIKWNTDADLTILTSNMRALFRSPSWKDNTFVSDSEKFSEPLEYLDFRFGNKVFYKQKGKMPAVPIETGTSTQSEVLPTM
jgi:hypothetical protein